MLNRRSEGYTCEGVTLKSRQCTRPASYHFERLDGTCMAHYCKGHAGGSGVMRMLKPHLWEYDQVRVYKEES